MLFDLKIQRNFIKNMCLFRLSKFFTAFRYLDSFPPARLKWLRATGRFLAPFAELARVLCAGAERLGPIFVTRAARTTRAICCIPI